MVKQLINYREYTTHTERESGGYISKVKDFEDFEDFVSRVTENANLLNDNQIVISISYPSMFVAVITYKEL